LVAAGFFAAFFAAAFLPTTFFVAAFFTAGFFAVAFFEADLTSVFDAAFLAARFAASVSSDFILPPIIDSHGQFRGSLCGCIGLGIDSGRFKAEVGCVNGYMLQVASFS
jgi:hypothetical protein